MRRFVYLPILVLLLLLAACVAKEVLIPKSPVVPTGLDLSGYWQLRVESEDSNRRLKEAEISAAGGNEDILKVLKQKKSSKSRRDRNSLVHVFLETGVRLKITQNDFGLFISFDRSIVEEYRFGENREVSVGPINADRVSGWDASAYLIETLDDNGNKLVESYRLADDVLLRQISIYKKGELSMSVVQKYDRTEGAS